MKLKKEIVRLSVIIAALIALRSCGTAPVTPDINETDSVGLWPDYAGVTFPSNIAAPSFRIQHDAQEYQTEIGRCGQAPDIILRSEDSAVEIPLKKWRTLLEKAAGDSIYFRILLRQDGKWHGTPDIVCHVSAERIDPYLVYRLLYPGYELWSEMGIYQRDLTSYRQTPVLENKDFGDQCINCHSFAQNDPTKAMMTHVRGKQGGTLISKQGKVEKFNSRVTGFRHGATYPQWNPDGRFLAFSANEVIQVFHSAGAKKIEVSDVGSDLMVYDSETYHAFSDRTISGTHYMETYLTWTPDGNRIYFCRTPAYDETTPFDSMRYDLCRIDFDRTSGRFSNLKTVYEASADTMTVTFPRVSPDGRWLMFTRARYGNFTIWHPEAQLCLMDLHNGNAIRELDEVNSNDIESYHSFSSNGRWFVFSSKRMDGLYARPFIASFDPATGQCGKPFPIPQPNADYYDMFTRTFNIPELAVSPIDNPESLLEGITQQQAVPVNITIN